MTELVTTWQRFAEITVKTNDLDPMYAVIRGLYETKPKDWVGRYVMHFILFYDPGGAYWAAENTSDVDFWDIVWDQACDSKVRRGTERRHFRGVAAQRAVNLLRGKVFNQPWFLLEHMWKGALHLPSEGNLSPLPRTYTYFNSTITKAYAGCQLGPYFIWKLYDILNICLDMPISLSWEEAVRFMPSEPRKAAEAIFGSFERGLAEVHGFIRALGHPVRYGICGLAEAETVLCMLKGAFLTKSHTIGDDIEEKWRQLDGIPELQKLLPARQPWSLQYQLGTLDADSVHS